MNWKEIVGTLVPAAASFIPGPLGAGISAVAKQALGLDEKASDAQLEAALATASPEQLANLKQIMNSHVEKMAELGIEADKLNAADRDSARRRQVDMNDHTPTVIAVVVISMWVYVQYFFLNYTFPEQNSDYILRALGILDGILIAVVTYYFGSSKGSKDKDKALTKK